MLNSISVILMLAVAVVAQQQSVQKTYTLHGTIKDATGAVIGGLGLIKDGNVYRRDGNAYRDSVTDINGEFKIDLTVGDHVLTIDPPELYPFRAFIKISDNGLNPDNVEFVIDRSKICCSFGAGHPFPKALSLPYPAYPAAARAVRARGEVIVALKVNGDGKVLSAKAQNGHPLLRAAAEAAGRGSRFESPTKDADSTDQEIRVTYVFTFENEKVREGTLRYTNQYRIDLTPAYIVDTFNSQTHPIRIFKR